MDVEAGLHHRAELPRIGELVSGKYRLERYIAEGGMGILAVARHVELDEPVVLKFLKPDIVASDPTGTVAGRFVREARATIKIRSEHVPRIFDVTTLDVGVPFIVMELLLGEDLDRRLEIGGPLPIAFTVDMLLQSLEALAAAHALGMVHRDLKPANLFVAQRLDGSPCIKVLDFGIAKLVERSGAGADHGLTVTNAAMGSPRYMSPEQMRSARDVDARADIWAVGTTLYELLTGVAPFDGETLTQVCAAILQDEPEAMSSRRPEVPPELEAVVRRCLAKRPDGRYRNVAELAAALAPFGTAPAAYEMASRVARVLGPPAASVDAASPAASSLVASSFGAPAASTDAASSRDSTAYAAIPLAPSAAVGVTSTAWGALDTTSQTHRRRIWTLASAVAVLVIASSVLVVAIFRSRGSNHELATAGVGSAPPANLAPSSPQGGALAVVENVPPPASAEALTREPGSRLGSPPAPFSPSKSLGASPPTKLRSKSNADFRPAAVGGTKPPIPATGQTKTSSPPLSGGLWDDRK